MVNDLLFQILFSIYVVFMEPQDFNVSFILERERNTILMILLESLKWHKVWVMYFSTFRIISTMLFLIKRIHVQLQTYQGNIQSYTINGYKILKIYCLARISLLSPNLKMLYFIIRVE